MADEDLIENNDDGEEAADKTEIETPFDDNNDEDAGEDFLADWDGLGLDFDGGEAQGGRALSQDEIDNLLGFDEKTAAKEGGTGIEAIIESGMVSYERLPMLEIVFDRLVRMLSTSLRNFTSDNVEISIDSIRSVRFGDYLNSIPASCDYVCI